MIGAAKHLSMEAFRLIGLGLCVLLAVGLLVVPAVLDLNRLDEAIAGLKVDIQEQQMLHPAYQSLLARLRKSDDAFLPNPKPERLAPGDLPVALGQAEAILNRAGFNIVSMGPDPQSIAQDAGRVLVNGVVYGRFTAFRDVLRDMGGIPYSEGISEVRVDEGQGGALFKWKLWLAVKK